MAFLWPFLRVPECGNKKVNVVDNGLLLEEKENLFKAKEKKV